MKQRDQKRPILLFKSLNRYYYNWSKRKSSILLLPYSRKKREKKRFGKTQKLDGKLKAFWLIFSLTLISFSMYYYYLTNNIFEDGTKLKYAINLHLICS